MMDEISIGALNVLFGSLNEETDKPKGIWANPNLSADKLKKTGFKLMG